MIKISSKLLSMAFRVYSTKIWGGVKGDGRKQLRAMVMREEAQSWDLYPGQ